MKIKKILLGFAFVMGVLLMNTTAFAQKSMKLKTDESKVEWTGKKVTGEHTGSVLLKSGVLIMEANNIIGGEFVMDMSSITNKDITNEKYRGDLVKHLKSPDFFSVVKFPEAKFVVTGSEIGKDGMLLVNGVLTIKGITNPLKFGIDMHKHGESYHMSGMMVIDRTKYDIKYGSGSFFDNLGDRTISDNFELKFDLMF
ncbi:YceI family protein [Ancylomarina sp. 16SWW S1-10-2]|uniref:YceI family protein n=1 Tax=Ancylomarina sp. 16SWW S1-10-2 TaxID=2499681 RepID=UPI0012AE8EE5|nr:YceI family protein [Ancylomarina sp. 16SWW S1-10-2]MRT92552.1 YceI family protein [Ancylomarina sp. 16SWW S1-10-2]